MKISKPYTYLIGWSKIKKYYYGVRYKIGCQPDDLWKKYFTSSYFVKCMRETFGEPDIIQIRKVFDDIEQREKDHGYSTITQTMPALKALVDRTISTQKIVDDTIGVYQKVGMQSLQTFGDSTRYPLMHNFGIWDRTVKSNEVLQNGATVVNAEEEKPASRV